MLQKPFFDWSTDYIKSYRLHRIFNKNAVKVSYGCMQNISKIYKGHNSKITSTPSNQLTWCICWVKEEYPTDGKCQTMDAVLDCRVTSPEPRKMYFGLAERKWNKRYYNYTKLFSHNRYLHETALSIYV